MTLPDALTHVKPGPYLGRYNESSEDGARVDVAIYEDTLPEDIKNELGIGDAEVFTIQPVTAAGDELGFDGHNSVIAALQNVHKESDGNIAAELALAASSPEAAADTLAVFKSEEHFRGVLEAIARQHHGHIDRFDMNPSANTNISPQSTQRLGFSATGQSEVLHLELHDDHEPAAVAA